MAYLRLVRFPNLLIVVLTQFLLQYLLVVPALENGGIPPALDLPHFILLVISTLLIAASGYVINDLTDYPIDLINKPEKVIINRLIPEVQAWNYYYGLIATGFIISLYLAWYVDNLPLVLIYPSAVALLYWYSTKFKATVLWGNIIVGLFCAFVAGIVFFAERHSIAQLVEQAPEAAKNPMLIGAAYLAFAFFSTLFREVIKDLEDVLGDEQGDCRTFPIVYGIKNGKRIAGFFGLLLLFGVESLGYRLGQEEQWLSLGFVMVAIVGPLIFALYRLWKAEAKQDFHFLSQFSKYVILSGVFLILLLG